MTQYALNNLCDPWNAAAITPNSLRQNGLICIIYVRIPT